MNKIIYFISLICLFSCITKDNRTVKDTPQNTFYSIKYIDYNNHEYIVFLKEGNNFGGVAVVHNPDCKYCK